jgi:hypothetical protein
LAPERLLARQAAFDARWNAHDEAGILDCFASDATVQLTPSPPPPMQRMYRGHEEIAGFVRALLPGFRVESTIQVADDTAITWTFAASCDAFRQMGVGRVSGSATARLREERFEAFQVAFDELTIRRLIGARGKQL